MEEIADDGAGSGGREDLAPEKVLPDVVLQPEGLKLEGKEKKAMVALAKVIGRTPRTLKRFVNVYRLIKAGLRDEKLKSFKGTSDSDGEFRAVLVLLGVAHGAPEVAPIFFKKLKERHEQLVENNEGDIGLKAFLMELKNQTPQDAVEGWASVISELLKFAEGYGDDIPLAVLRRWAPTVVRYTFQLGHLSEAV